MEEVLRLKHDEIEKNGLLDDAQIVSDDLFEIDPADFIDPDEFGLRPSVRRDRDTGNLDLTNHA
jgi:hypothetical protein